MVGWVGIRLINLKINPNLINRYGDLIKNMGRVMPV